MKKVVIISVLLSLAVVVCVPQPTLAMGSEGNSAGADVAIVAILVISGVALLWYYTRDEGPPVKNQFLSEMRSVSTPDGKLVLFQWWLAPLECTATAFN